jgi:hypothetical protein
MSGNGDRLSLLDEFKQSGELGLGFVDIHLHQADVSLCN